MKKLSKRQIVLWKLSKRDSPTEEKIIQKMRQRIKQDPEVQKKFDEYGVSLDEIDKVHIEFCDLPVSAKTKDKKIYLNRKMLEKNSDVDDPTHYLVHEMIHFLQQVTGKTKGHKQVRDYLDKPTEESAFKSQIDYKKRHEGEEEAERYTEDLVSYHGLKGKEKEEKKEELLEKE